MAPSRGVAEVAEYRRRNDQKAQLVTQAQATYRPPRRPRTVLDEDTYVDSLAAVIKRNFFPDSRRAARHEGASRGEWSARLQRDVATLSLEAFQAKYTSEDDASFLDILDRANLDRRERYHWLYTGRRLYAPHVEQAQRRIEARERFAIEGGDDPHAEEHATASAESTALVPARGPRNALMHGPEQAGHLIDAPPVKYSESNIQIRNLQVPGPADAGARSARQGSPTESAFEREVRAGQAYLERQRAGQYELIHDDAPSGLAMPIDTINDDMRDERPYEMPAVQRREQTRDRLAARLKRASTPASARHASPPLALGRRSVSKQIDRRAVLSPAAQRLLLRKPTPRTPLTR